MPDEGKTRLARQRDHALVGALRVAEQPFRAECGGATFQILQKRRADARTLPAILDRQAEFETAICGIKDVAGFAHDGLEPVDLNGGDDGKAVAPMKRL